MIIIILYFKVEQQFFNFLLKKMHYSILNQANGAGATFFGDYYKAKLT